MVAQDRSENVGIRPACNNTLVGNPVSSGLAVHAASGLELLSHGRAAMARGWVLVAGWRWARADSSSAQSADCRSGPVVGSDGLYCSSGPILVDFEFSARGNGICCGDWFDELNWPA